MKTEWFDRIIETDKEIQVTITKKDVYDDLYETCDSVHASCNKDCPVYEKAVEDGEFDESISNDCPYFKNGVAMYKRLRGKRLVNIKVNGIKKTYDYEKVKSLIEE